jgi:hypothetical protein
MRLEVMDEELGRDNLLGMRSKNIKLDHKLQTTGGVSQVSPSRSLAFKGKTLKGGGTTAVWQCHHVVCVTVVLVNATLGSMWMLCTSSRADAARALCTGRDGTLGVARLGP